MKKGIFMPTFAILMLVVFSYSFYLLVVYDSDMKDLRENIGNVQINIFDLYQTAPEDYFYLTRAVDLSHMKSLIDLSRRGGVPEECNTQWRFNSICTPNITGDFLNLFEGFFEEYGFSLNEVKIEDQILEGSAEVISYEREVDGSSIKYSVPASFSQGLGFDIHRMQLLRDLIERCLKDKKDLEECVPEEFVLDNNVAKFSIIGKKPIFIEDEFKPVEFSFKINLDDTGF